MNASVTLFAQNSQDPNDAVRGVINQFEVALQEPDVKTIEELVSPDIVVFENGHRKYG
jgi:ketosteroid isomerase-like protein